VKCGIASSGAWAAFGAVAKAQIKDMHSNGIENQRCDAAFLIACESRCRKLRIHLKLDGKRLQRHLAAPLRSSIPAVPIIQTFNLDTKNDTGRRESKSWAADVHTLLCGSTENTAVHKKF